MKYILPDGRITVLSEQAYTEFFREVLNIEENSIEFARELGFRKEFTNIEDLLQHLSDKLGVNAEKVRVERIEENGIPKLIVKVQGIGIGKFIIGR